MLKTSRLIWTAALACAGMFGIPARAAVPSESPSAAVAEIPPADGLQPPDSAQAPNTLSLVQMLGDETFAARERATSKLIEIGLPAKPALEQGCSHSDREIRFRCERILGIIDELDFQRRLAAFAVGRDDQHGLPGWDRFREAYGDTAICRSLFADMQRSEPDLMRALEGEPQAVAQAIETRCSELQQLQRLTRQNVALGTIAAMLFAASDEAVALNFESGTALGSFCYQSELQSAMNDSQKRPILAGMLGQWIQRSDGWTAYQALSLAMRYGLKEGLIPARKVLENPGNQPYIRQNGILAIAKMGGKSHIPLLESLLDDRSRCASQRVKDVTYETQIRDVALAALVIMADQEPRDFGFDRLQRNEMSVFITGSVGFENDDQRQAAFDKWKTTRDRRTESANELPEPAEDQTARDKTSEEKNAEDKNADR